MKEKTCTVCKLTKPEESFSLHGKNRPGRLARCKSCVLVYSREIYYPKNRERIIAQNTAWQKENWERVKKNTRAYVRTRPERTQATNAVNYAVRMGRFEKSNCRECSETKTDFHHTNGYDKENWFVGVWLCRTHHASLHKELRREKILGGNDK